MTPPPCEDVVCTDVVELIERLSGRPISDADGAIATAAIPAWPGAAEHAASGVAALSALHGIDGAQARSRHVADALGGQGFLEGAPKEVGTVLTRGVSEWARSDGLVLAESDIEGFLRYASLCREVQAGGALKLSIDDRGRVYRALATEFESSAEDRVAILAIGSGFWAARDEWLEASYDQQQEFARGAPLPPPMSATSVDYALVLTSGDLPGHAANLHATLGPLAIRPASVP